MTYQEGKGGDEVPVARDSAGRLSVVVEMRGQPGGSGSFAMSRAVAMDVADFQIDHEFKPLPMQSGLQGQGFAEEVPTYVVRGTVQDEAAIEALRRHPDVAQVWMDAVIAPFMPCPIPPCDCSPGTPKGTIADVATYLGVNQIWKAGFKGAGMVVGVVDGGITAVGRPVRSGETPRRIPNVIDGWPTGNWGTEASAWGEHGNMCATDVLGMAPEANLYDLRISGPDGSQGTVSKAAQAYQWAIDKFKKEGTPQVLTNSWGIYQKSWDPIYATDPNHFFTRKVVEAINLGILVLFAAGNCGEGCPDGRCGTDVGPGKSIWGANGHPAVMTVGAVNTKGEFVGYSSQGPAALDPQKPDFCSVSHFAGYFPSDTGTSAATPIMAGVVALCKQAATAATQAQVKAAFQTTAKDIGPAGWDNSSGYGIIRGKQAYDVITGTTGVAPTPSSCDKERRAFAGQFPPPVGVPVPAQPVAHLPFAYTKADSTAPAAMAQPQVLDLMSALRVLTVNFVAVDASLQAYMQALNNCTTSLNTLVNSGRIAGSDE